MLSYNKARYSITFMRSCASCWLYINAASKYSFYCHHYEIYPHVYLQYKIYCSYTLLLRGFYTFCVRHSNKNIALMDK